MKTSPDFLISRPNALALAGTLALFAWTVTPVARAATYDWSGATSGNMSGSPANWGGTVPTGTDVARWNASSYTNAPTANASQTIGELLFDAGNINGITFGTGALTLTLNGISGTGILINSGSGAVNTGSAKFALGAAQSWTNNSANALTVSGTLNLSTFVLTLDGTGSTSLGGVISGTGGVAISNGTVTLSGTNTFTTGGLTLNSGTLNYNNTKAVGAGAFIINGGTIDNTSAGSITSGNNNALTLNGDFAFTGTKDLNLGTGATSLGTAAGTTRTITVNAGTLTLAGVIANGTTATSITKSGNGALTLTGANTFTGGVTLNAGTLNINSAGVAATSGPLGNGGTFTLSGGTIDNTSGTAKVLLNVNPVTVAGNFAFSTSAGTGNNNLTLPGAVTLTGSRTITTNGTGTLTFSGAIGESGSSALTKAGTGTLVLNGNNTFSGGFNILNGQVNLGTATGAGAANTSITLGDTSGSNSATLFLTASGGATYNYNLTVAAGTSGILRLLGASGSNGGVISGNVALNNSLTINSGVSGKTMGLTGQITVGSGAIAINTVSGDNQITNIGTVGGIILGGSGSNGLTFNDAATNTMTIGGASANITGTGPLTFNNNNTGTITVAAASINHSGSITNSGTGSGTTTISGIIGTNVTGVTQNSSTSSLVLSGLNTYSGTTTVSAGTLLIANSSTNTGTTVTSGPTGTGNLTLNNGVTIASSSGTTRAIYAPVINLAGNITVGGTTTTTGRLQFGGVWDLGGGSRTITLGKSSTSYASGNEVFTFTQPTGFLTPSVQNGSLTFATSTGTSSLPSIVRAGSTTSFASNASLTIGDGVAISSGTSNFFTSGTSAPALTLAADSGKGGGILQLGDGVNTSSIMRNAEIYSLSGAGMVSSSNTSGSATTGTLTINNGNNANFSGNITEAGGTGIIAVSLSGSGTQIFSGTNTYSGATTIGSAATLQVNSTTALSSASQIKTGTSLSDTSTLNLNAAGNYTAESISLGGILYVTAPNSGTGLTLTNGGAQTGSSAKELNAAANATVTLGGTVNGSNFDIIGSTATADRAVRLNGAGNFVINSVLRDNASGSAASFKGGLDKRGAGLVTVASVSTYTGTTVASAGELRINGSINNTSSVTVSGTNTVLSGTGTIGGTTTISTGSILAPGANTSGNYGGTNTLTFNSGLTINSGAKLNFDSGDLVRVTGGALTLNGGALTIDNGVTLSSANTYTLFDYTGGTLAGSYANLSLTNALGSGLTATFGTSGNTITLTLATGVSPASGTLTISAPSRVIAGTTGSLTGSLANSGSATSNLNISLTSTGSTTVTGITPSSGTVAPGASNTSVSGSYTAGSAGATNSLQLTNTDGAASPTTAVSNTATTTSVANRVITAGSVNLGKVLVGTTTGSQTSTLSSTTAHNLATDVTVNGTSASSGGASVLSGTNTTFNGTTTSTTRSVTGTFTTSGSKSGSVGLSVTGEGLANETVGAVNVGYTADVYQAASLSGNYTGTGGTGSGTVDTGTTLSVANAATSDGGQRAAAAIVSNTLTGDSAWTVSGSGLNVGTVINAGSSTSATSNFSSTGKLNGTYNATLTLGLQHNDQTIAGTLANDLGSATWQFSHVVSGQTATSGTKAQTNGNSLAGVGLTNSGGNGTNATILAGTSDGTTTSVTFTTTSSAPNDAYRVADVTNVTTGTGAFVLQLSYNELAAQALPGGESSLFLAWHVLSTDAWINAVLGNTGNTGYATSKYSGTYAQFLIDNGLGAASLSTFLGAYGVDTVNNTVWAVLNHNSEFTVVPEPSTYAMLLGGVFMMAVVVRRKRNI